ncbi:MULTISPECIES: hypothetical protein [unclassified Mycolicibacterium]|uniref:hypothetical protein n=1 Tax=unclassified Mycolicibacterium TaxID=2636767 RepID=UPI0012DD233E|nr:MULTISPECIES: hypothetical protein [unclassified Mycolicibacterium]MUL85228.1 hypothetical protein [Mycolicibacterium sp. CBMA 329]MUL91195.1 hypothetical protein [Mycolicibacterium sp. CBMA 331]MUL98136.1 hypothetical protein [Mycolicibacterium sp. CBMA 334]MUM25764.1 hypothetical protein [Mycolicibacterium sp. CBMA 295]MUM40954.1 hypothetical protein [Mycolicibacterium sp. CBMA 247]
MAGVGGLGLGLFNLWRGTREQARLHQRQLRGELRDALKELRGDIERLLSVIKRGDDLPDSPPTYLDSVSDDLTRISEDLASPGSTDLARLRAKIVLAYAAWPFVTVSNSTIFGLNSEQAARRRIAAETELRSRLETTLYEVNKTLRTLRRIDNGNLLVYLWHLR